MSTTASAKPRTVKCQISGEMIPLDKAIPVDLIRDGLLPTLKEQCPNLDMAGYIGLDALNRARIKHAEDLATHEIDDLLELKKEVAKSLLQQDTLTKNVDQEFDAKASRGEKIADRVASFGGSWTFIIIFLVVLFVWMGVNTKVIMGDKAFDLYPYVFLNLILSCLAAIQAPVIMMSQNRQAAKDRMRNDNDYQVNLKAELEIQAINEKIDKLLSDQWKHLLEIQEMQMEMIQELTDRKAKVTT